VRAVVITLIFLLLPLQAQAQVSELTLSCEYKSVSDLMKLSGEQEMSGSFSAVVRMTPPAFAKIEATTEGCGIYNGWFDDLEVSGDCERTIGHIEIKTSLRINRINGAFEETFLSGNKLYLQRGRCVVVSKKLF
jgi:hypothetical protein